MIYFAHSVKGRTSLRHKFSGILIAILLLFVAAPVWAHHSPSAVFDMSKEFTLSGTLTKVDWINPHIVVFMDAKKDDGSVENWKFESNPPSWFRRVSAWAETILRKPSGKPSQYRECAPRTEALRLSFEDHVSGWELSGTRV